MAKSRRERNADLWNRQKHRTPHLAELKSLRADSAMYIHRFPFEDDLWEAKHANRGDIVGYGKTRIEALTNWERCLQNKIDEVFCAVKEEADSLDPTEMVGVFHIVS
jgi:hypothetical protein